MIEISVSSRKFNFSMQITKKITVIRGDSGKGKTMFYNAVADISGAYQIRVSDSAYKLVAVPKADWYDYLDMSIQAKRRCIYVIDDESYIKTKEFSKLVKQDTFSFYILINRFVNLLPINLGGLPYAVGDVYRMLANGIMHKLVPYYERPQVEIAANTTLVVEDSRSGFLFFNQCRAGVIAACGKDKIIDLFKKLTGTVFLIADMASLGSSFDLILETAKNKHIQLLYDINYLSFEYFLLSSRLFNMDLDNMENSEIAKYISHEQMCEDIIFTETRGTPYQYNKGTLSKCYLQDCCCQNKHNLCRVGIHGNKLSELFRHTKFEHFMNEILASQSNDYTNFFVNY